MVLPFVSRKRIPTGCPSSGGRRGWIGIDAGTVLTTIAQVERRGHDYRISARWSVPSESGQSGRDAANCRSDLGPLFQQIKQARSMFRGRRAAAVLSASVAKYRCLDMPFGSREELRRMVHEELRADENCPEDSDLCYAFWEVTGRASANGKMTQVSVVDVDRETALGLARNLHSVGWDCRILDALPCALARAAHLSDPRGTHTPTAVIDLGHSSAVLIVAVHGGPQFTRVLRGGALGTFVRPLQESLHLSPAEAHQLLRRIGIAPPAGDLHSEAGASSIHQLMSEPAEQLISEIQRTLSYLDQSLPSLVPERIVLCGGGALVRNLPERLAAETGIETRGWSMPADHGHPARQDDALFAVAAALSVLAWEKQPCT